MRFPLLFVLPLLLTGCSVVIDGRILPKAVDCTGEADGTPCVGGDYCFADQCRFSFCGDGIRNADRGEECDDGNALPGDGCEPITCQNSCDGDTPCADDGNVCNGPETCIASTHACESGPEAGAGTTCSATTGAGACSQGFCVPPGCGDASVVEPEECDPPNGVGCQPDCTWQCTSDLECPEANPCQNDRFCDVAQHACVDAGPLPCNDDDPCTANACEPATGCSTTPIDGDGDGYSPMSACGPTSALIAGDCDDMDAGIHPDAPEQCNGIDDNCVGGVDENVVNLVCYPDKDEDGVPQDSDGVEDCHCPSGYLPAPGDRVFDCNDNHPLVKPRALSPDDWWSEPTCPDGSSPEFDANVGWVCRGSAAVSWDYDCSRVEELRYPLTRDDACSLYGCNHEGWVGEIPGCGAQAGWGTCTTGILGLCSDADAGKQSQMCR